MQEHIFIIIEHSKVNRTLLCLSKVLVKPEFCSLAVSIVNSAIVLCHEGSGICLIILEFILVF